MKKFFGLVFIFVTGCGIQPGSWKIQNLGSTAIQDATATPTQIIGIPTPNQPEMEMDVTDGHGKVLSTGEGRSIFQRVKKPRKRCVVKQIKKGLFIGGEK